MKAFISYSHDDSEFLKELHKHLSALRRQKLLDTWTDREIDAGGVVDSQIEDAMKEASLFLLLVSSSFINSDYCYEKEFQRALEKQKAGRATIIPIIVRPCDWMIPELRKFKALPEDGKAVHSSHWHSADEAFADIAQGLRRLLEKRKEKVEKFVPDDRHVTAEQREELRKVHEEVVRRLIAKKTTQDDDVVQAEYSKWAAIVWSQFHEAFGTKAGKLPSLPREKFDEAKSWFLQYRASNDKKLKRVNPQAYRVSLTKTIYSLLKPLGWTKDQLYAFAAEKLDYAEPIKSLSGLGNNQLELVRDRVRYEKTKKKTKAAQAKARSAPRFGMPVSEFARELLQQIQGHPNEEERGLTEILCDSPSGPLYQLFIANTTAAGAASSVKKSLFRPAVAELLSLGWLLQPEEDDAVRVYELNPNTRRANP
ncbi:MAG: toll/interleukin-1 receptor domain-containing protein [Kiritimatiellae bacterium]|nr:toll/interleukin-1 receptor domain-containing protein [Kiritimatiellia bacterium]